jgi:hypothetical protein
MIQILFIRHAETDQNAKLQHFCKALQGLSEMLLPSWEQIIQSLSLIEMREDSQISPRGQQQLLDIKTTLNNCDFWSKFDFDICAYSPYARTRMTCFSLIPLETHFKCTELELLREIAPHEHLLSNKLHQRVMALEKWIKSTRASKIILVGHSKYFQELLNMDTLMWNCDIWQSNVSFDSHGKGIWTEANLLFRSPFAGPHPTDQLRFWPFYKKRSMQLAQSPLTTRNEQTSSHTSSDPELEPQCRICQAYQSELPELPLFSPCLCSGSQAYVHRDCLKQWRATSPEAYHQCSVCQYAYQVKRPFWAKTITSSSLIWLASAGLLLGASFLTGCLVSRLAQLGWIPAWCPAWMLRVVSWQDAKPSECLSRTYLRSLQALQLQPWRQAAYRFWFSLRCHGRPMTPQVVRCGLLGLVAMGLAGQAGFYSRHLLQLREDRGRLFGAIGVTCVWFNSADLVGTLRLWMLMGLSFTMAALHGWLLGKGRQLAQQAFGEEILEVGRR